MFVTLIFAAFPITFVIVGIIAYFIKKRDWSIKRKRRVFIAISTFLLFPTLMPTGTLFVIPVPNIALIGATLYFGNFHEFFPWHFKISEFIIIAAYITGLIMWGISKKIFLEKDQTSTRP